MECLTPLAPLIRGELIVPLTRGIEGVAFYLFGAKQKNYCYKSPQSDCNRAKATTGAVSARRIRGPRLTVWNPYCPALSISARLNPPSGPIKTATVNSRKSE